MYAFSSSELSIRCTSLTHDGDAHDDGSRTPDPDRTTGEPASGTADNEIRDIA